RRFFGAMLGVFSNCLSWPDHRTCRSKPVTQSITRLAALITAAHFSTSPGSMAATSVGVLSAAGMPCLAIAARTESFDSAVAISEVKPLDNRRWRARRREQSRPGIRLDPRHAALG